MHNSTVEVKSLWAKAKSMRSIDLYKIYSEKSILPRRKLHLENDRESRHQQI